jgi:HEAT repeat protein
VIQDQLLLALVRSKNEAADDVLIEALRIGNEAEQLRALDALLQRKTTRGLGGAIGLFERLTEPLQLRMLRDIKILYPALRDAGRSEEQNQRIAAMKLIALGRQGRLTYVLSENLHEANELVARAASESMLALARWVASETRALQRGIVGDAADKDHPAGNQQQAYELLMEQRPEIESSVARALDVHRGRHGPELLRAAMLLCDSTTSRAFRILATPKHGGQTPLVRRLQQPPASEHVDAFLLGASHGHLRSHFSAAFAHIAEAPVLDAILRKSHWLKDHQLQLCMHQVARGAWWVDADLKRDLDRRRPEESSRIADWMVLSSAPDAVIDEQVGQLWSHCQESPAARLRVFRAMSRRRRGTSVQMFRTMLSDSDERIVRMAAREIVRRRPPDFENMLLQMMTHASQSVRRVVGRVVGKAGFEHFWNKFDRLPKPTRKQAGSAMLKLLSDAPQRLRRRLISGPVEQRVKALQIVGELSLAETLRETVITLCQDPDPRVRSKAVLVAGDIASATPDVLVERLLHDADARVRANTIEVLENKADPKFVPVLTERARAATNRERANAIKALFRMRVSTVSTQLFTMLRDGRPEHRISAMWALRQVGWWQLLGEVGRLAKQDENIRVRRYAIGLLKGVAEAAQAKARARLAG